MKTIKEILTERDGMSAEEAEELIQNCKEDLNERVANGEMPDDICQEYFGLEPDYMFELLF